MTELLRKIISFDGDGPSYNGDAARMMFLQTVEMGNIYSEAYYPWDEHRAKYRLPGLRYGEIFQPADMLSLTAIHLAARDKSAQDMVDIADTLAVFEGITDVVDAAGQTDCSLYLISAGYKPPVEEMGRKIGFLEQNIIATPYPKDYQPMDDTEKQIVLELEKALITANGNTNQLINRFVYDHAWMSPGFRQFINEVIVVSGERKTHAIRRIVESEQMDMSCVAVVGDGDTDAHLLGTVHSEDGLSIAINASRAAIPYATFAVATTDMRNLLPVLMIWREQGKEAAVGYVHDMEKFGMQEDGTVFNVVRGMNGIRSQGIDAIVQTHLDMRTRIKNPSAHLS